MNSAKKQSAENNLHLRVMTAKAKIIARAEETARDFSATFGDTFTVNREYFIAEAEAKEHGKTAKEDLKAYIPAWMTSPRWNTGERRKAAKLNAYGLHRVLAVDMEDSTAREEHRHPNTDKPAWYIAHGGFSKDPRPTWTKEERRTA